MIEVKWSPRALRDIKRLHDFVYEKNQVAAKEAAGAILNGTKHIEKFPEIGKPVENLEPKFREFIVPFGARGYIIRYCSEKDIVVILAIRHYLEVYSD